MRRLLSYKLVLALFTLVIVNNVVAQQNDGIRSVDLLRKNASKIGLAGSDFENLIIKDEYYNVESKSHMIFTQQTYKGLPVYNSIQSYSFKGEEVVSFTGSKVVKIERKASTQFIQSKLSAEDALRSAALYFKLPSSTILQLVNSSADKRKFVYTSADLSREPMNVELIWVPSPDKKIVWLCWQVEMAPIEGSDHWLISVDAMENNIVRKDNLTVSCSWEGSDKLVADCIEMPAGYNDDGVKKVDGAAVVGSASYRVSPYPAESPNHPGGAFALVSDPWNAAPAGSAATTLKWHTDGTGDYIYTRGNNVYAQEDRDKNNATTGLSAQSSSSLPNLSFDYSYNTAVAPVVTGNQSAAVTNLFYWNNITHDISYLYGFDEVSGNFQSTNLSRGGLGNDAVVADAQDASGVNNANFFSPSDGSAPRMQMFLWNVSPSQTFLVNSPASFAGYKSALEGSFSVNNLLIDKGPVTGNVALFNDNAAGTTHLGCAAAANTENLLGKIVVVDRGSCGFTEKVKNAQLAGAIAVIVVDNATQALISMGGTDNSITVPAVMIRLSDGNTLKTLLQTQNVNVTLSDKKLDGDFDNGVIIHEYTHGISNRLTGGPAASACLQNAEQMGEGWSDYFALMLTTNWSTTPLTAGSNARGIGTYVVNQPSTGTGIRSYPYSTNMLVNPLTYGNLGATGGESHAVGEIWCAMLWEMTWSIIQKDGLINGNFYNANAPGGNSVAMKLVTMGMKLQSCSPGFIDGRDAILKADTLLYNGAYSCTIWSAFAKRGLGFKASQGSSASVIDQVEDYTTPASATIRKTASKNLVAMNEEITYSFKVTAQCQSISNYKIVDTLANNVTYVTGSGGVYNSTQRTVTFSGINVAASGSQTLSFKVKVNTGTYSAPVEHLNETVSSSTISAQWAATTTTGNVWTATNSKAKSAPYAFFAAEPATLSAQYLSLMPNFNLTGVSTLSFWHYYDTENGYDGGVVELSTDGGASWFDAGGYMKQNGYNTRIDGEAGTVLSGRNAFAGMSNGFIQTIIDLSVFKGKQVKLRFVFASDVGTDGAGWFVDDIVLKSEAGVYNAASLFDNTNAIQGVSDTTSMILNVLPVQWASFTAEKKNKSAILLWSTLTEQNSKRFIVERSADGNSFLPLTTVEASGNSNFLKSYSYTDAAPLNGINYYRIRQEDLDGKTILSEVRSLFFDDRYNVSITPNPASDVINIRIPGNTKIINAILTNSAGQKVKQVSFNNAGMQIDISNLARGIYYIQLNGSSFAETHKLVIK